MKNSFQLSGCILFAVFIISGCSKHIESSSKESQQQTTTQADELVGTPTGLVPRSHVHVLAEGEGLRIQNGHLLQINRKTGETIRDFGLRNSQNQNINRFFQPINDLPNLVVNAPSYVTFSQWQNTSTNPITSFSTSWTVPNNPVTPNDAQLIYIWNGLLNSDGTDVMQPVLQWGPGPDGGGNFWAIANWYVWNVNYIVSAVIPVNPGTNLQGVVTLNGTNTDGSYNYTSSFTGYANSLSISEGIHNGTNVLPVPQQYYAFEALEAYHTDNGVIAYGVAHPSDYPSGLNYVTMNNISTYVNNATANSSFTPGTHTANFGEHTFIASDPHFVGFPPVYLTGMQMIYFHAAPLINGSGIVQLTASGTPCSLVGYAGSTVSVKVNVTALRPPGTATGTFTITTPGVTFTNGSTSITATTNTTVTQTVVLPSSGQISGTATIHVTSGSANGGVAVN